MHLLVLLDLRLGHLLDRGRRLSRRRISGADLECRHRDDLNRPPLPEMGSRDVRAAAHAVNWMQRKLQDYVAEREHLAAALAHDLRTPVTRLRLRFELSRRKDKAALITDLAEIEAIIRSVIEFASHERRDEAEERIDLVSLVESVCYDFPQAKIDPASVQPRTLCSWRPIALKRCLTNLIDNAINMENGPP
jgi:signal transduction histidine kinase